MKWFYNEVVSEGEFSISGEEFRHITQVMRIKTHEHVVVFDGKGNVATCEVVAVGKKDVTMKVVSIEHKQVPEQKLVLAAVAIKGDRQETMLRQATELGVTDIVLLSSDFGEVKFEIGGGASKLLRLQKILVASCKQCHRAFVPTLSLSSLAEFKPQTPVVLVGSFEARSTLASIKKETIKNNSITILVGPEGGFSPKEEDEFSKLGYTKVSLGQNVLRADTAATMMISYAKCTKEW